jgi:hypothetical protein
MNQADFMLLGQRIVLEETVRGYLEEIRRLEQRRRNLAISVQYYMGLVHYHLGCDPECERHHVEGPGEEPPPV